MVDRRVSIKRTVYYDKSTDVICQCTGNFWKTCSLRVINDLPCKESIISITPIVRECIDPADNGVRTLDASLKTLQDGMRALNDKLKTI